MHEIIIHLKNNCMLFNYHLFNKILNKFDTHAISAHFKIVFISLSEFFSPLHLIYLIYHIMHSYFP